MSKELRVRIDDAAHAYLKTLCTEQELTLAQVVNALIWQAQQPKGTDDATKQEVILLQLQRLQMMIEALLPASAPQEDIAQPEASSPLPSASYEDLYGPHCASPPPATPGEEHVPEYFRPQPKRSLLNRLLYKVEDD